MANSESPWTPEVPFRTEQVVIDPPPGGGEGTDLVRLVQSGGWYEDFSNTPTGGNPKDHANVDECSSARSVNDEWYAPGSVSRSIRTTAVEGDTGFGRWGMRMKGMPKLREGGEVWMRAALKYPSDMDWSVINTPALKLFRIYRKKDESHTSIDFQITSSGQILLGAEAQKPEPPEWMTGPGGNGKWIESGAYIQRNRWHMLECYALLSSDPTTNPSGILKVWLDGELRCIHDKFQTFPTDGDSTTDYHRWHTYWNETPRGSPKTQSHWMSHMTFGFRGTRTDGQRIDTTPHMAVDSTGFPYLGMSVA